MAERRMFSKSIIDGDAFLDMAASAQALYFHLGLEADDDGFINNAKKIMRMVNAAESDMEQLCKNDFIIRFESGIVVVTHWKIHNYIRGDRFKKTLYQCEKSMITVDESNIYRLATNCQSNDNQKESGCQPEDNQLYDNCLPDHNQISDGGQHRLVKDRLVKNSLEEVKSGEDSLIQSAGADSKTENSYSEIPETNESELSLSNNPREGKKEPKHIYGECRNVRLRDSEFEKLKIRFSDYEKRIDNFSRSKEAHGYKYASDYQAILIWAANEEEKKFTIAISEGPKPTEKTIREIAQERGLI